MAGGAYNTVNNGYITWIYLSHKTLACSSFQTKQDLFLQTIAS